MSQTTGKGAFKRHRRVEDRNQAYNCRPSYARIRAPKNGPPIFQFQWNGHSLPALLHLYARWIESSLFTREA